LCAGLHTDHSGARFQIGAIRNPSLNGTLQDPVRFELGSRRWERCGQLGQRICGKREGESLTGILLDQIAQGFGPLSNHLCRLAPLGDGLGGWVLAGLAVQAQEVIVQPANARGLIRLSVDCLRKQAENKESGAKPYGPAPEVKSKHSCLQVLYRPVQAT
jgi:hypothetical protein